MKTIVAAALSLMVAVSLTPSPSLAQSMSAGGSHSVLALLDDQDVQGARENQDVQAPRENQDVQAPRAGTMSHGASNQAPGAVSPTVSR